MKTIKGFPKGDSSQAPFSNLLEFSTSCKSTFSPPPISCCRRKICWVDYPRACGICIHSVAFRSGNFVHFVKTHSLRFPVIHFTFISCTHLSTAQLREKLISISQAHSFRFSPSPFQRFPAVYIFFCGVFTPRKTSKCL